jgi:hypothetical protein
LDLSKVFARRAFPFLELLGELGGVDNCMRTGRSLLSFSLARGRVLAEGWSRVPHAKAFGFTSLVVFQSSSFLTWRVVGWCVVGWCVGLPWTIILALERQIVRLIRLWLKWNLLVISIWQGVRIFTGVKLLEKQ